MTQTWDIDTIVPASTSPSADIQKIIDGFSALRSCFSGAVEPASADQVAYMLWADTANDQLKQRNAANSAWIVKGTLSAVYFGLLSLAGGNLTGGINAAKTTVASAATPDIFAVTVGNTVDYTGTATATGFATAPQAGCQRMLVCSGAAVFTAGANLLIDGVLSASNFTAAAGDKILAIAITTTQFRLTPMRYDGAAMTSSAPTQTFRGLSVRSHPDSDSVTTKIMLMHADEIVTQDAFKATPADRLVFDKSVTGGAGGMQSAAVNSTWNKLYYIRKRSDGTEGLYGLRAKDYNPDQSQTTDNNVAGGLNFDTTVARLAQGIQVTTTGELQFVDIKLNKAGSPTGNYWLEVQSDTAGSPSGSVLATSDKYDVSRLTTTATFVRIPFRTPATLTAATQYHLVLRADTSVSAVNYFQWFAANTSVYANGVAKRWDGAAWQASTNVPFTAVDFCFKLYVTRNDTAISLPSGYDQYAQIGWFYLDSGGLVKPFVANDRQIHTGGPSWKIGSSAVSTSVLLDAAAFIPPIPASVVLGVAGNVVTMNLRAGRITATDFVNTITDTADSVQSGIVLNVTIGPTIGLNPLMLEYQGVMVATDTNTGHFWINSIIW